ncbi:hypothetical protein TNCV_954191 [Trichonephila clavipes]|nr:hypothetical protein TNCV_954191 [Trichonephila clavipes]
MGSPKGEKGCRYNVLSVSHGSVMTARLDERVPTMRRDRLRALRDRQTRDQRNRRTEELRVSNSMMEIEQASSHYGVELLNSEDLTNYYRLPGAAVPASPFVGVSPLINKWSGCPPDSVIPTLRGHHNSFLLIL